MILYLSGPMTGIPEFNFPEFHAVTKALRLKGHTVFNPAENFEGATDLPWEEYLKEDLRNVIQSEAVGVLRGWENSKGANLEVTVARALGLPILDAYTLELHTTTILQEADRLTSRDRQQVYGHPLDDFTMTAELWTARFKGKLIPGEKFAPEDVATAQRMVKESRLARSPDHPDSLLDIAGYARTQEMCGEERKRREHDDW